MNRRGFLQAAGMSSAAIAALSSMPKPVYASKQLAEPPDTMTEIRFGAHRLGPTPQSSTERLIVGMSDSVFRRLCEALDGKTYRMTQCEHVGDKVGRSGVITDHWHNGFTLNLAYASAHAAPPFEFYEDFVAATSEWYQGLQLCLGPGDTTPLEAFGAKSFVGLPTLPIGLIWSGHYIDERTGMAMRAMAQYDIWTNTGTCRWDVICG